MRIPLAFLICAALAVGQSHPSWWNDASPGATALVGIDWQSIRQSPFADAVEAELWGDLGFPDIPCLRRARQIVISSPDLLALIAGNCPALRGQVRGFEPMTYRGVDMYFSTEKGVLSFAQVSDQLLMVGEPKTLEMAVDRTFHNAKEYSPLLARAAQFSGKDLWVVASQLPDDLANRFVPLTVDAVRFEGFVSVRNGLEMDVSLTAASENEARASAEKLEKDKTTFPSIASGLQVTAEGSSIQMVLTVSREQVLASMRGPQPEKKETPVETVKMETPKTVEFVPVERPKPAGASQEIAPVKIATEKAVEKSQENPVEKPVEKPQIVRIVGLDDGPKEFVLPPAPKNPQD